MFFILNDGDHVIDCSCVYRVPEVVFESGQGMALSSSAGEGWARVRQRLYVQQQQRRIEQHLTEYEPPLLAIKDERSYGLVLEQNISLNFPLGINKSIPIYISICLLTGWPSK